MQERGDGHRNGETQLRVKIVPRNSGWVQDLERISGEAGEYLRTEELTLYFELLLITSNK